MTTTPTPLRLTPSEVAVLRYYRRIAASDGYFCRSLKTIARECRIAPKTVARANHRFMLLGILLWTSGNSASWRPRSRGQANRYDLNLTGFYGFDVPQGQAARLRRLTGARSANQPT